MSLNSSKRYSRQLPLLGFEGQEKLRRATVLIAGLGGLGSVVSLYLAAAGIGSLIIYDPDFVEESNLNRQILYDEASLGLPKSPLAARRIRLLNSSTKILYFQKKINKTDLEELKMKPTLIVDALDNWDSRLELDSYACEHKIPLVHAAIDGLHGQLLITDPAKGVCLKCISPKQTTRRMEPIPSLGAAVGVLGSLEALAAINTITGKNWLKPSTLYIIDLSRGMTVDHLPLAGCTF